jgi:general secretion pathway protein L
MTRGTSLSFLAAGITKCGEQAQGFGQWWLKECLDLVPQQLADWLVDSGGRALVLAPEPDAVVLHLKTERGRHLASERISREDYAADRIDEFLGSHRQSRAEVSIGLSLRQELIFYRNFALPLATRRMLETVVVQDLLANTPFQLDDIHHGHRIRRAGDRLVVSQSVIRRAHVVAAGETLGLEQDEISFVESSDTGADDAPPPIVTKRSALGNQSRWVQRIAFGLAVSALLLASAVLGTRYYRQQEVLDGLHSEMTAASAKAKGVLSMIDKLQQEQAIVLRLRAKRDESGLLDLWEEATRILPAHTWLSELRLSEAPEGQVVITGFSAAAANLVGLLDRSAIFAEAALVGPIAVHPTEGKERFIIQTKLKSSAISKTASR